MEPELDTREDSLIEGEWVTLDPDTAALLGFRIPR